MDLRSIPYANHLTPEQAERVQRLVAEGLSLEDRWLSYGKVYGAGAGGRDPLTRVKELVRDRIGELQKIVCGDEQLLKVLGSPTTGAALGLAFAVTGKMVAAQFHDVDVVQLGVLIAQCGIFAICAGKL